MPCGELSGLLVAEPQIRDKCSVLVHIRLPQIIQQPPALPDHLEQSAAGVMVLVMLLEMPHQIVDPLSEQSYLDASRPTIRLVRPVLFDYCFPINRHTGQCLLKSLRCLESELATRTYVPGEIATKKANTREGSPQPGGVRGGREQLARLDFIALHLIYKLGH